MEVIKVSFHEVMTPTTVKQGMKYPSHGHKISLTSFGYAHMTCVRTIITVCASPVIPVLKAFT